MIFIPLIHIILQKGLGWLFLGLVQSDSGQHPHASTHGAGAVGGDESHGLLGRGTALLWWFLVIVHIV